MFIAVGLMFVAFVLGYGTARLVSGSPQRSSVLFFPDRRMPCYSFYKQLDGQQYRCTKPNCTYAHDERAGEETSLMSLIKSLNEATSTIDLCIFEFTQRNLADFLIIAKIRGVEIRILTGAHSDRPAQQKPAPNSPPPQPLQQQQLLIQNLSPQQKSQQGRASNNEQNGEQQGRSKGAKRGKQPVSPKGNAKLVDQLITAQVELLKRIDLAERGELNGGPEEDKRNQGPNDQIVRLHQAGIPVKICKTSGKHVAQMHDKFAIVDNRVLLMGSLDWTQSGILKNHWAVIKTSETEVVTQFVDKFEQIWSHGALWRPLP